MSRYSFQRLTICPFCNKDMTSGGGSHIYKCHSRPIEKDHDYIMYLYCLKNFPEICDKNVLNEEYNINLLSLPDLNQKYNIPTGKITFLLDYFGLHRRNASEGCLLCAQPKIRTTCLKRYGGLNVLSKGTVIYDKRNKTVIEKYGVTNVFKLEDIKRKIVDDNTFIQKYGVDRKTLRSNGSKNAWKNKSAKDRKEWIERSLLKDRNQVTSSRTISKLEYKIFHTLHKMHIPVSHQFMIEQNGKYIFYDIKLDYTNIIIEINGDYYHANPIKYKPHDIMNYPGRREILACDVWKNDLKRKLIANYNGYEIIYIWEDNVNNLSEDQLINYLYDKLSYLNAWKVLI